MKRVYFLKPIGMSGPIKIGCSHWPEDRLKAVDIWSPFPLELLTSAPGEHRHERALHYRFRDTLCHGEWFAATPELCTLVEQIRFSGVLPELPAAPYGKAKTRARNPNRNRAASLAKSALTRRITYAERHAWGRYLCRRNKPAWVKEAIASWQGAFTPFPDESLVAKIEGYIAELLSRPKETRSYRELWNEYRQQVAA